MAEFLLVNEVVTNLTINLHCGIKIHIKATMVSQRTCSFALLSLFFVKKIINGELKWIQLLQYLAQWYLTIP